MTIAPKRRRPRVWDDAQVIAWIVHKTERAVIDASGLLLTIAKNRPVEDRETSRSIPFALAQLFVWDILYFADGTPATGKVAGYYADAEKEFEDAIAEGRLKRRDEDHFFNAKDVKAIWPGSGRGNSEKRFLDSDLVNKVAVAIACGADVPNRADVFRELRLKGFAKQEKQRALLRAAIHKVTRHKALKNKTL